MPHPSSPLSRFRPPPSTITRQIGTVAMTWQAECTLELEAILVIDKNESIRERGASNSLLPRVAADPSITDKPSVDRA